MDEQVIFNWIIGVAGALGGWTLKVIWDSLMELRREIKVYGHQDARRFCKA